MIKVFYDGWAVYKRFESSCIGIPTPEPIHGKDYSLFNHNIETLCLVGSVTVRALSCIGLEEKFMVVLTDKDGNPAPFEIVKGQDIYQHENGNALKLIFDDAPPADIAPTEKELSESERTTLLKMIYGMAIDGYGFNPEEKKSKLTGQASEGLSAQLLDVGIDVSYKSVKRYIDAAKELFESARKDKCTPKN